MSSTNVESKIPPPAQRRPKQRSAAWHPFLLLKRLMPRGLYGRSLIIIVAPIVLLQAIVTYVFLERHWQMVTERLSSAVVSDIALLVEARTTFPEATDGAPQLTALAWEQLEMSVSFRTGERLPEETITPKFSLLDSSLRVEIEKRIQRPYWIDTVSQSDYVDIRIQMPDGVIRVLPLRSRVYATNSHIFLVWMVGASLVLITIAILFLRNQIRPIERLALAAESFGKGRDITNFRPAGAQEVRRAAAAFIDMKERILRQIEQRTAMLAGVSHDLRTPLTRFKLQIAMMGDSPEIDDLKADVRDMEHMLEDYLAFARGEEGEMPTALDLVDLLREIQSDNERKGHIIALETPGTLPVTLRRNAIKRCLTNLVDNAVKHGDTVRLTLSLSDKGTAHLHIDDNGEGIPEAELEEVFRPFYRLDTARNLDHPGTGLGLAIALDIARAHGGDIQLSHSPLGGLRAEVTLPL
ncbi:MAG: two-component sensor histidine kinase [Alphaproteobacteria bacterium]|nr:two-component sensor histidine kinase [Rhodobiaceae bacterium]MBO6543671.1 two-component sensor histidine kinase [Alphaproteobacteria bacterium]MBO6627256.1 two-component sensor histidine kinase [Alphaproteobacteria bacterium]